MDWKLRQARGPYAQASSQKNRITSDYGTELQIAQNHASGMAKLGMKNGITGLAFILFSIFKYINLRKK